MFCNKADTPWSRVGKKSFGSDTGCFSAETTLGGNKGGTDDTLLGDTGGGTDVITDILSVTGEI